MREITEPYQVKEANLISVCMNCYPKDSIFNLFPDMRGRVQISHGLCPGHLARFRAEMEGLKK